MAKRSEEAQQIASLLGTARSSLGLSLAFMTRMDGATQTIEVIDARPPLVLRDGLTRPQDTSLCQAILDGKLPPVMGDLTKHPEAMKLPAAKTLHFRSFVSVPVILSDGTMYGTFCAAGFTADKDLDRRDKALMDVLAHAASVVIEPRIKEANRRAEIEGRLAPVFAAGGPTVVVQPIVALSTGALVGVEALSRFPASAASPSSAASAPSPPDRWFAEAHSIGEGVRLELLALERAADHLPVIPGYVAMNASPMTLLSEECPHLLRRLPLSRVLLELSEHEPVEDYEALRRVLAPLRASGLRLAIDDVGAGFSSLRHIVLTTPDVIKIDRSLVDGVSHDPVLRTLVKSLVEFGHGAGAGIVAEGIESADDAAALLSLGVDYGQGWHFGRPGPPSALALPLAVTSGK